MNQLLMNRRNESVGEICFPEGFFMRTYQQGDGVSWCECCIDGKLGLDEVSEDIFEKMMMHDASVNPNNIFFLISPTGEVAGTVTYQYNQEEDAGTIHMVGIATKYKNKGLAVPMTLFVVREILADGKKSIFLTTDDWRLPAIKTYLRAGFSPVYHHPDMEERWNRIMEILR